jgi:hypothetical protein
MVFGYFILFIIFAQIRVVSSVGLEHYLDRVGATGSNPVQPTAPFVAHPEHVEGERRGADCFIT